jgi:GMP synthase-like glutamine amidotransferase
MDLGDPLPDLQELDGLVVMGGPMGALDDHEHPHLPAERELLAAAVAAELPVLGVCLGAQLLAAAAGAKVYHGPVLEVGLGTVDLTDAGRADPVLGPAGPRLDVLHWHQDTFELPDDAVHLASSDIYPHQAFRLGEQAYGLQFHLELDATLLHDLTPHLPSGLHLASDAALTIGATGRPAIGRFVTSHA